MDIKNKLDQLTEKAAPLLAKGADGLTEQEKNQLRDYYKQAKQIKDEMDIKQANTLFDATATDGHMARRIDAKSLRAIMPRMVMKQAAANGITKGIGSDGSTLFPIPIINTTPYAGDTTAEHAPRLIDMLPTVTRTAPVYDAIVESGTTGNAAVVQAGGKKPQTTLALKKVEQRLQVIATVSDPIDKYALQDTANLDTFIGTRLTDKVLDALEAEVLSGTGADGHLTGLASVKNMQEQAFDGNMLDTLAAGVNKLEVIGVEPRLIAVNPADWLALQRQKNNNGDYYMSNVLDAVTRKVWGVPVAVVAGLTAGTAYIIGRDAITLSTDGQIDVEWNPYTGFNTNQTIARVEGRWQLDCYSPQRVVKTSLASE